MQVSRRKMKRKVTWFVLTALLFGVLPMRAELRSQAAGGSRAAERPALRNPRMIKTTQEVAPGPGGQRELKNPTIENGITTWDSIWFGNYWQEDTNGDGKVDKNDEKQPIKWRVLSTDGDDVFLLADKNIDMQKYNNKYLDATWETSTIRSWLNGYGAEANKGREDYSDNNFLDNAFTKEEQSIIKTTNVVNDDDPEYNTENDISDQVYLLSIDEVMNPAYGFTSDAEESTNTRIAVNTGYVAGDVETGASDMDSAGCADDWWLRSLGSVNGTAANVWYYGYVDRSGSFVCNRCHGVRPVMHLNLKVSDDALSFSNWSYAGTVTSDDIVEWDSVWFGNYWQEDTNGDGNVDQNDAKQPIKWRVLSVNGDDAFLMADKNLDAQDYDNTWKYDDSPYDDSPYEGLTWETCTIRSWLNGYGAEANKEGRDYSSNNFLTNAFSADERSAIQITNVVNNDNPYYDTEGGNDTSDQVYLLSLDEVINPAYGFSSNPREDDESRSAENTGYGEKARGELAGAGAGPWWLRTPGSNSKNAVCVFDGGRVQRRGYVVDEREVGYLAVRPALHLNLNASSDAVSTSSWSYAGTVMSNGGEKAEASPQPTEPGSTQKPATSAAPETTKDPVQAGESTVGPTMKPSEKPFENATMKPSMKPDESATMKPSEKPAAGPTSEPSSKPAAKPSFEPGTGPILAPNSLPSIIARGAKPSVSPNAGHLGIVSAVNLKQKKKSVKVSWKKVSGAAGYQVCYSASEKWKGRKQKRTRKNKIIVKKLKKKKTYYFRVRAYRMVGTRKEYGGWSKTKKITIKK